MLTFLDFFAGIGGFHYGLTVTGGFKCVGYIERDKHAQTAYQAMYDTTDLYFSDDICEINGEDLPKADVWCGGFPCQDISISGSKKGLAGERSGLFYEFTRLIRESGENRPDVVILENVKNLFRVNKGTDFAEILFELDEIGYDVQWHTFNSKDFGVPQNRERVFLIGFSRTAGINPRQLLAEFRTNFYNPNGNSGAKILKFGDVTLPSSQSSRIYDTDGLAPTLSTRSYNGLKVFVDLTKNKPKFTDIVITCRTHLTTAWGINRLKKSGIYYEVPGRIRSLTPLELWRLQGFPDELFHLAEMVTSNAQLGKQAGNSVTVPVISHIGLYILDCLDRRE